MNIYVGNLSRTVSEDALRQVFEQYGQVASVRVMKDKFTGEARGFAFVTMPDDAEAQKAITGLDGFELEGRKLKANEAREPEARRPMGGNRFNRGGGSGGSRGGMGGGSSNGGGPRRNKFSY